MLGMWWWQVGRLGFQFQKCESVSVTLKDIGANGISCYFANMLDMEICVHNWPKAKAAKNSTEPQNLFKDRQTLHYIPTNWWNSTAPRPTNNSTHVILIQKNHRILLSSTHLPFLQKNESNTVFFCVCVDPHRLKHQDTKPTMYSIPIQVRCLANV